MKKITILSGKGGVGKSSITASLAVTIAKDKKIVCADCDVDASNLSLVLGATDFAEWKDLSTNEKAVFDHEKCTSCGKCAAECYFDAIEMRNGKPFLRPYSCEGCGLCEIICPSGAVKLQKINNAKTGHAETKYGFRVYSAQLNTGQSGSGKVVSDVRKRAESASDDAEMMLIDSAAGIGCPVIASVTGTDYAIIVTEPTPSGISDMKKAFEIVNHFNIPCSIIINKYDLSKGQTELVEDFAKMKNISILAKIPFDKKFAKALTEMVPIIEYEKSYESLFNDMKEKLMKE